MFGPCLVIRSPHNYAIILMSKRKSNALLKSSSWCLVIILICRRGLVCSV